MKSLAADHFGILPQGTCVISETRGFCVVGSDYTKKGFQEDFYTTFSETSVDAGGWWRAKELLHPGNLEITTHGAICNEYIVDGLYGCLKKHKEYKVMRLATRAEINEFRAKFPAIPVRYPKTDLLEIEIPSNVPDIVRLLKGHEWAQSIADKAQAKAGMRTRTRKAKTQKDNNDVQVDVERTDEMIRLMKVLRDASTERAKKEA